MPSFVIAPVDTVKLNCVIPVPQDFGETEDQDIDITWKYLTVDERKALIKSLNDQDGKDAYDMLAPLIVDIDGLKTPDGEALKYSKKVLRQILNMDYVLKPIREQFENLIYGEEVMEKLRQKN